MITALFGVPPVNWIGSSSTLMTALLILSLWTDVGYNIVLLIASIQNIPHDYYEAAQIDGAGPIMKFFRITLPLLGRTFAFVCAMALISQFQVSHISRLSQKTAGRARGLCTEYLHLLPGFYGKKHELRLGNLGYAVPHNLYHHRNSAADKPRGLGVLTI